MPTSRNGRAVVARMAAVEDWETQGSGGSGGRAAGAVSPADDCSVGRSSSSGTFLRDPTPSHGRSSRSSHGVSPHGSDSGSGVAHVGDESDFFSLDGSLGDGPDGGAIALDVGPLVPLELEGDQETWLCSVDDQVDFGEPDVWSDIYWSPPTVDFEFDFGGADGPGGAARRSVCSMSVQRGEPEAELDCFADWIAQHSGQDGGQAGRQQAREEDVQLLFPAGCTQTDMGWLLLTRSVAEELEPVDLLFPEGCSEKDMEWLVAPTGSVMEDDGDFTFGIAAIPPAP